MFVRAIHILLVVVLFLPACKKERDDGAAARMYRAAWAKRVGGDEPGCRAGLEAIAKAYPASRAGQRARRELSEGAHPGPAPQASFAAFSLGIAAAIALPAYLKYVDRVHNSK